MLKTSRLLFALAILLCWQPAFAGEQDQHHTKKAAVVSPMEKEELATAIEAHKMMGHINLAYLALDIGMPKDAIGHIDKAEALAGRLKAETPSLTVKSMLKYGKVSYTSQNTVKSYYVPVADDVFLLSEYDPVYRHLEELDLNSTDAGIVDLAILIDLRKIEPALKTAKQDINRKNYMKALIALAGISKDAVVDEKVVTDPLLVVYDNLALAKNFIHNGQYLSARYTLQNVKKGLAELEKEKFESPKAQSVTTLKKEIAQLDTEVAQKNPTLWQRVEHKFSGWMKTVKSWF